MKTTFHGEMTKMDWKEFHKQLDMAVAHIIKESPYSDMFLPNEHTIMELMHYTSRKIENSENMKKKSAKIMTELAMELGDSCKLNELLALEEKIIMQRVRGIIMKARGHGTKKCQCSECLTADTILANLEVLNEENNT